MSENSVSELENETFSGAPALTEIALQSNLLTWLRRDTFAGVEHLEVILLMYDFCLHLPRSIDTPCTYEYVQT